MKKIILNILFILLTFQVFGQFSFCDSLVMRGDETLFSKDRIKTTKDFIEKYFPDQSRFFSNRNELQKLNLELNMDSIMIFSEGDDMIKITFRNRVIENKDFFYPKAEDEKYSRIREYNPGEPFGIISEDTLASFVSEIIVNDKKLPPFYFFDLLNPNKYETMFAIKPIEVYLSKDGLYFYIYVFGKLNTDIIPTLDEAVDFSYMAKIVLSRKGYFIDRIVIPGDKLKFFGFSQCPYFIGF